MLQTSSRLRLLRTATTSSSTKVVQLSSLPPAITTASNNNTMMMTTTSSSSSLLSSSLIAISKRYASASVSSASTIAANAPPPPPGSGTSQSSLSILAPARSPSLHDLAMTECPLCHTRTHIKEVLRHLNNDHRPEETETQIDKTLIRKLVRERYTALHTAIKQVWARSAPKGSIADKSKGGFPCRHCKMDETGLNPLFPTVDALMKHIGNKHEEQENLDMDDEPVPKRMTADDVNQKIEFLRNGTNSGIVVNLNNNSRNQDISSSNGENSNNNSKPSVVKGISIEDAGDLLVSSGLANAPLAYSTGTNLAYRCEFCNKQTDREIDMLQHYDNAHGDIVFDLGLTKKLTVRNFIGDENVDSGTSGSNSNNKDREIKSFLDFETDENDNNSGGGDHGGLQGSLANFSSKNTSSSSDCWVKPILAPYNGVPSVLIIPYAAGRVVVVNNDETRTGITRTTNNNSNNNTDDDNSSISVGLPPAPPSSSTPSTKVAPVVEEAHQSPSELPLPPPTPSSASSRILDITEAPPPPPSSVATASSSKKKGAAAASSLPSYDQALMNQGSTQQSNNKRTVADFMMLRCEHCNQKMKSPQAYEYHLKDKHGILVDLTSAEFIPGLPPMPSSASSPSATNISAARSSVITAASLASQQQQQGQTTPSNQSLDAFPYFCTFGSCHRKQFGSKTAFEAHVQAKHPDINFNQEIEKIEQDRRRKFMEAKNGGGASSSMTSTINTSNNSSGGGAEKLALALVCKECGKTGFVSYTAYAMHLQDKHNIIIEKFAGGVNTSSTRNIFSAAATSTSTSASSTTTSHQQQIVGSDEFLPSHTQLDATYECEHCGKAFSTFSGYDNHVRSKHSVSPSRPVIHYIKKESSNASGNDGINNNEQQTSSTTSTGTTTAVPPPPSSFAPPSFPADLAAKAARNKEHDEEAVWSSTKSRNQDISAEVDDDDDSENSFLYGNNNSNSNNSGPLPPPSNPNSNSSANNNNNSNKHQLKNPWWCSQCNRGFASAQALQGHNLSKHGYRPAANLPCPAPSCKKTCADQFALLDHLKQAHRSDIQTGAVDIALYEGMIQGYTCYECGKKFLIEREMDNHMMNSHSGLQRPGGSGGGDSYGGGGDAKRTGAKRFNRRF